MSFDAKIVNNIWQRFRRKNAKLLSIKKWKVNILCTPINVLVLKMRHYRVTQDNIHTPNCFVHPSPKIMADFFPDTKINMMPSPNLYDFWWVHKMHASGHFPSKIYCPYYINPFCTGGLNAVSVFFFKSSLNIIVDFLLTFDGFKWNLLNFKLDTFP